jgi:hypothetical protein
MGTHHEIWRFSNERWGTEGADGFYRVGEIEIVNLEYV